MTNRYVGITTAIATIAVVVFSGLARAKPPYVDWTYKSYVGASGSWASALGDIDTDPELSSPAIPLELSLDSGYVARVVGGGSWGPIRGEGELAFLSLNVEDIVSPVIPSLNGD